MAAILSRPQCVKRLSFIHEMPCNNLEFRSTFIEWYITYAIEIMWCRGYITVEYNTIATTLRKRRNLNLCTFRNNKTITNKLNGFQLLGYYPGFLSLKSKCNLLFLEESCGLNTSSCCQNHVIMHNKSLVLYLVLCISLKLRLVGVLGICYIGSCMWYLYTTLRYHKHVCITHSCIQLLPALA